MSLPEFTDDGLLPPGDYLLTLEELRVSHLVQGGLYTGLDWDREWRLHLVDNLEVLVRQLWQVGIERVFVDGSFVEAKCHPADIDGYFECDRRLFATRQLHRALNNLDPYQAWTWDHRARWADPDTGKLQLPLWHYYRIELYPHFPGVVTGITDPHGNELEFPSAFRLSRSGFKPKGIVELVRSPAA